jgi:catechol 2,3-dioxygenase-like lactoylglutathione lyase family enzyme
MAEFPAPDEGIVLTHFIVSADVERSRRFYADVLGGDTVREGEPSVVALANSWIINQRRRWPHRRQADRNAPNATGPRSGQQLPENIRVADIQTVYAEWSARGAEFLTPPQQRKTEFRCYIRDPDGHLIEVGQKI